MNYHLWKSVGYVLASALVCVLLLMMYTETQHAVSPPSDGGTVVFVDDFERTTLGEHYRQGEPDPGHKAGTWQAPRVTQASP